MDVYDSDGNKLGDVPLSPNQQALLERSGKVSVLYHTPQLLQNLLGRRSGSFMLYREGDKVVALTSSSVKEFLEIQAGAKAARSFD